MPTSTRILKTLAAAVTAAAILAPAAQAQRFRERGREAAADLSTIWREMQAMEDSIDQGDVAGAIGHAGKAQAAYEDLGPLAKRAIEAVHPGTEERMKNLPAEAAELAALRASQLAAAATAPVVQGGYSSQPTEVIIPPANVDISVVVQEGQVVEGSVRYVYATGQTYLYYGAAWIHVEGTYATSGYTYYAAATSGSTTDGYVYVPASATGAVYYSTYSAQGAAGGSVQGEAVSVYAVGANGAVAAGATQGTYTTPNGQTGSYKAAGAAGAYQAEDGTVYSGAAGGIKTENGAAAGATAGKTYANEQGGTTHESKQAFGAYNEQGEWVAGTREGSTSTDGKGNMTRESEWDVDSSKGSAQVEHEGSVQGAGTGDGSYSGSTEVTKNGETSNYSTEASRGEGATSTKSDASGQSTRSSPRAQAQSQSQGPSGGSSSGSSSAQRSTRQQETGSSDAQRQSWQAQQQDMASRQKQQSQSRSTSSQGRQSAQQGSQNPFAGSGQGLGSRETSPQTQSHLGGSSGSRSSGGSSGGRSGGGSSGGRSGGSGGGRR